MKKRRQKLLLIIVAIIMIVMIFILINKNQEKLQETSSNVEEQIEEEKQPVEWHANYIWDGSQEDNTWMCFRKKVNLDKMDSKIIAQIAVDSKYWLYINGEMVIREGALKRGEKENSIYYDEVDLTNYFKKGENTIAMLVWYWGDDSFSHIPTGAPAMLFQAKMGENYVISDDTWKVAKNPAFLQDELRPNNRLVEYNVLYDASMEMENWYAKKFDDSTWQNATVLGTAGQEPWGEMIERCIPQFKDYGLKEYENSKEYTNYETTKNETLLLKIPYNAQFTPYLKIKAPEEGLKITIKTDMYEDRSGDSVKCTYLTKEGEQEFESPAWMNGENVYYEIPKGIKILDLQYRESGYDCEITGSFQSDDEFFNQLWKKASRTLYVNMRDSYMDCPNRERAQWFGDMNSEMMQAMYALDINAYDLYEKGIRTTINWKENKVLYTVTPLSLDGNLHLPVQMLAGISYFYDYYKYTGKKEFLEYVYPSAKDYLNLYYELGNGLVHSSVSYPIWEWGDSTGGVDYEALENAWYYFAMSNTCQIAELLGYKEDVADFKARLERLKTNYDKLWTKDGYKTPNSDCIDERANAIAVIAGLAEQEKYPVIKKILTTSFESTTYMEKYILEALCQMGNIEEAQERIKTRYDEMVNGKNACSTLWENWNYEIGTRNHAWAGGPLVIMSKYFAGIEPLEKGYDIISIKPEFGNLKRITSKVTTIKGDIVLHTKKEEKSLYLKAEVPAKARIAIEKVKENCKISVNNKIVYKDEEAKNIKNVQYDSEDEKYIYFYVEAGEYVFEEK